MLHPATLRKKRTFAPCEADGCGRDREVLSRDHLPEHATGRFAAASRVAGTPMWSAAATCTAPNSALDDVSEPCCYQC